MRERLGFGRWDEVDWWESVEKWKVGVEVGRTSKFGGAVIVVRDFEMMDGVELISASEKRKVWEERRGKEQKLPAYGNGKYYRHLHVVGRYMLSVELALALFSLFT